MKELLFSYGTLQKGKVQWELFGRSLKGTKDVLEGYIISEIEIKDEAFLFKGEEKYQRTLIATNSSADRIEGTVLEISEEELQVADKYEPDNYKRIKITLRSGKEAWIYIAV
ncbi:MAG: gamma-glutamylcyclotransferase [Chitinophagaceae bacterium]|nr:gamma-glutamylcyclotransferase [Chitinophagaceae bacterium]